MRKIFTTRNNLCSALFVSLPKVQRIDRSMASCSARSRWSVLFCLLCPLWALVALALFYIGRGRRLRTPLAERSWCVRLAIGIGPLHQSVSQPASHIWPSNHATGAAVTALSCTEAGTASRIPTHQGSRSVVRQDKAINSDRRRPRCGASTAHVILYIVPLEPPAPAGRR
ncbi:hypothetical protein LZ31DRAFT_292323 [Colletotrichum somersetense]|nr:hypothetical protein LZ31DRAFT_292323 [Colletotrichum somersetense]